MVRVIVHACKCHPEDTWFLWRDQWVRRDRAGELVAGHPSRESVEAIHGPLTPAMEES
jgi:hypothetical protein